MKKDQPWPGFDPSVHEPVRFIILEDLYQGPKKISQIIEYAKDKDGLKLTEGNIASHLSRLEDAKYIEADRHYEGRRPKTVYKITDVGRKSFERHLEGTLYRLQETLARMAGLNVTRM